jgi:hypothetical protein
VFTFCSVNNTVYKVTNKLDFSRDTSGMIAWKTLSKIQITNLLTILGFVYCPGMVTSSLRSPMSFRILRSHFTRDWTNNDFVQLLSQGLHLKCLLPSLLFFILCFADCCPCHTRSFFRSIHEIRLSGSISLWRPGQSIPNTPAHVCPQYCQLPRRRCELSQQQRRPHQDDGAHPQHVDEV